MTQPPSSSSVSRRAALAGGLAGLATLASPAVASAATPPRAPGRRSLAPVGFVLSHEQFPGPQLVDWADDVEKSGFGYAWTSDHLQPWQDNQGHSTHPWLTQALIGERTDSLTFGTGVTCPTYRHHPSEVAQAWASLGVFYPGRVFLGVGTGEALNELAGTGEFGAYEERAARLIEAVQLIRTLWTGERVSWDGKYYKTVELKLYDLPDQPVPIYMAASGPKSAYNAGFYGDGWVCSAKDLQTPELRTAFASGARAAGKNPDTMPKLVEQFVVTDERYAALTADLWRFTVDPWSDLVYDPSPVSIQRKAEARWSDEKVLGQLPVGDDPGPHIEALQTVLDLGGTPFVHSAEPDQRRAMRFYERKVLPKLT